MSHVISSPRIDADTFSGLSAEQRVLVQLVSQSSSTSPDVRRRASALLLLDSGVSIEEVPARVGLHPSTVRSLVGRHRQGGVRAALLGMRPSLERRRWLALSPMWA